MEGNQSTMSTNDDQTLDNSVQPSDDTQPQRAIHLPDEVAGAQSRRKFLRTAVISGVAVATVGATAGVAAAASANGGPTLLSSLHAKLGATSGVDPCSMCFENTSFQQINNQFNVHNGHASPGDFYLWFSAKGLTPGATYTLSVTPDPGASPFQYSGSANMVKLFMLTAKQSVPTCPDDLPNHGTASKQGTSLAAVSPFTLGPSDVAVQVAFHIKWGGSHISGDHHYTFTATLKHGTTVVCTATVTVTAHGSNS